MTRPSCAMETYAANPRGGAPGAVMSGRCLAILWLFSQARGTTMKVRARTAGT